MKKRNNPGQKPVPTTSLQIAKLFSRFTRVQILGAVTLVAGIILIVLLLRDESPPTSGTMIPAAGNKVIDSGTHVVREKQTEVKGVNRPPAISELTLAPKVVIPGIPVRVEVKSNDPDQDDVRLDYIWKINGEVVSEQIGEQFDTTGLRKGDLLTVSVIPDDGKEKGQPRESNGILIQNCPPEITSMPTAGLSSGIFQYQVLAKDPDNEPLQFTLEEAPQGMTIDSTGMIKWSVPQGLQGKQQVRVIVSDGSGSCFQAFDLNLGAETAQ